MATGGDLGVLEVLIEIMNADPYLLLRMTGKVNAFINLVGEEIFDHNTLVAGLPYKSATEDC